MGPRKGGTDKLLSYLPLATNHALFISSTLEPQSEMRTPW